MNTLAGKVAIVTGGGSGNGLAIAKALAAEGAAVVIGEYSDERGRAAMQNIKLSGGLVSFVRADVSRWDDVDTLVSQAVKEHGAVNILVNNAGVLDGYATCLETSEALFDQVVAINLKSVFLVSKRTLGEMTKQRYGKIINIASVAGLQAKAGGTAYTASKHGVVGLTRQLACEYGPLGIRVNALCPGPVPTNLRATSTEILGEVAPRMSGGLGAASEEYLRELIPLGTKGTAEDVARASVFLASPDSDYMNGHALVLDGGLTAK